MVDIYFQMFQEKSMYEGLGEGGEKERHSDDKATGGLGR